MHVGGVGLVVGQVVGESLLGFERLGGVRVRGLEPLSQRLHRFWWETQKLVSSLIYVWFFFGFNLDFTQTLLGSTSGSL